MEDTIMRDGRLVPKLCTDCTSFLSQLKQHCVELARKNEGLNSTGGLALWYGKPNAKSLHTSVRDGCTACGWLWKCVKSICAGKRVYDEGEIMNIQNLSFIWQRIPSQDFEARAGPRYRFSVWCMPGEVSKGVALPLPPHRLVIDSLPSEDRTHVEAVAGIGPSTSSQATFTLIRNWMDECFAHHSVCRGRDRNDMGVQLPGRMLDVTIVDSIRLIQTELLEMGSMLPQYAALSHCWGRTNEPQLNTKTKAELRRGQPLASLPPTFRQAIELTRGLGLDYIWIDSLCIVQDSQEDWLEESVKMGGVYTNSAICISATDAVDHNGGCFYIREYLQDAADEPPQPKGDAPFRAARGNTDTFSWPFTYNNLVISVDVGSDHGTSANLLPSGIDRAALNTRAWVFQERMLAPRTIHCTKRQVMWECFEGWSRESHPISIVAATSGPESWGGFNAKMYCREVDRIRASNRGKLQRPASDTVRLLQQWSSVIEAYAGKNVTYISDKLIACSAITKLTVPVLGKFVAGLWEEHLASQLLWYRKRGTEYHAFGWTTDDQMQPRQAPTWSWASLDGEVKLPYYVDTVADKSFGYAVGDPPMIETLNVDVVLRGKDPIGPVTGGSIRMRCRALPLFRHDETTYPFHLQPAEPGGLDYLVIRWDRMVGKPEHRADRSAQTSEVKQRRNFRGLPLGAMAPLPWSASPAASTFVAVPISAMMNYGDVMRVTGLILERTEAAKGQYRRCGFFHTTPEYCARLTSTSGEGPSDVSAEEYSPQQGHTITLV